MPHGWNAEQLGGKVGALISLTPFQDHTELDIVESNHDPHVSGPKIDIGVHTKGKSAESDLASWILGYEEVFEMSSENVIERTVAKEINGLNVVTVIGTSEVTGYQLINIERGELVWFVWANDQVSDETLDEIVRSISFDESTPTSITDLISRERKPYQVRRSRP